MICARRGRKPRCDRPVKKRGDAVAVKLNPSRVPVPVSAIIRVRHHGFEAPWRVHRLERLVDIEEKPVLQSRHDDAQRAAPRQAGVCAGWDDTSGLRTSAAQRARVVVLDDAPVVQHAGDRGGGSLGAAGGAFRVHKDPFIVRALGLPQSKFSTGRRLRKRWLDTKIVCAYTTQKHYDPVSVRGGGL